ncbi:MAG: alpha-glucosidase C-terminal domain-containing protein, partial [Bacteroidota bacterium]
GCFSSVIAFSREDASETIIVCLNLGKKPADAVIKGYEGTYTDYFSGEPVELKAKSRISLDAWGYRLLIAPKQAD